MRKGKFDPKGKQRKSLVNEDVSFPLNHKESTTYIKDMRLLTI